MRTTAIVCYAFVCIPFAFLAACGGSQPPTGGPGAMPQSHAIVQHAGRGGSWMLPEAQGDLLYVTDAVAGVVHVLSYPNAKPIATLSGFSNPAGECVDKEGDVFITDTEKGGAGFIYEFKHGGMSPIATLSDPFTYPFDCAVDPVTGDLALVGSGGVAIFPNASGTPETFTDEAFQLMRYAGYDASGNLFIDGDASSGGFAFAELPSGSSNLADISISGTFAGAGAVQWDGQYITVQTERLGRIRALIDRLQVSGSTAVIVGTTTMSSHRNKYDGGQFWLQGHTVVGPMQNGNNIAFWRYPDGGNPKKTVKNLGNAVYGVTVSLAPSH